MNFFAALCRCPWILRSLAHRRRAAGGVLLALSLAGPGALAQTLRIVTIESAPFGFYGADGQPTGMMYEIGNLIAQEAGLAYNNRIVPYQRTVAMVAAGTADVVLRYSNAELNAAALPVAEVLSLPTIVVGKPALQLTGLDALHGKYVGIPRGGRFDDELEANPLIIKYPVSDYAHMLKMLMAGRLDAGVGSSVGIYYNAHRLGLAREQLGKPLLLGMRKFELHVSRKTASAEFLAAIQTAVRRLQKRGDINQVVEKYYRSFDMDLPQK